MHHKPALPKRQNGASLIAAVFLITGLAVLGSLSSKIIMMSSSTTISEFFSSRALFAAESGADWGAHYIQYALFPATTCPATFTSYGGTQDVVSGQSQFAMEAKCKKVYGTASNFYLYTIRSTGTAGSGNNATQRTLTLQFSP